MRLEFEPEEYLGRIRRAQAKMVSEGTDALLVTAPENVRYFAGYRTHRANQSSAPMFLLIPASGDLQFFVAAIELGRATTHPWLRDVRTYTGRPDTGVGEVADALGALGLGTGTVALELTTSFWTRMSFDDHSRLRSLAPRVKFVDAASVIWALRVTKSPAEIDVIRKACSVGQQGIRRAISVVSAGMSEVELRQSVLQELIAQNAEEVGAMPLGSRAYGAAHAWDRHLRLPGERTLEIGDIVWTDIGCTYGGYWCDYARMFCIGRAHLDWKQAYAFVHEASRACIAALRPGIPISAGMAAYRQMLLQSPYAEAVDRITAGRIAHGVGLGLIEPPSMSATDTTLLEEGMVLTIEPSIYFEKIGFFMVEEDVVITASGASLLNEPAPADLLEVG